MTEPSPTTEAFEKAVADFHKAADIEKTAESLRKAARKVILDYYEANGDVFTADPKGPKTVIARTEAGGVSITTPVIAGKPSRFDDERVDECVEEFRELDLAGVIDTLFKQRYEFAGPSAVVYYGKAHPEMARTIAGVLVKYTLPATEDMPGTPRVTPVK